MKIIFDLDGTLICSKKRLHELFCDLLENTDLSFSAYWDLKFAGKSNQEILRQRFSFTDNEIEKFINDWMEKIESDYYLSMDSLINGVEGFLKNIAVRNELYICTARQSIPQVKKQLTKLSIADYFDDVFVTEQKYTKAELLLNSGILFGNKDWFIGDTGHDINTGKKLGMKTCAVLSGFMSETVLLKYESNIIIPNVTNFNANNVMEKK